MLNLNLINRVLSAIPKLFEELSAQAQLLVEHTDNRAIHGGYPSIY